MQQFVLIILAQLTCNREATHLQLQSKVVISTHVMWSLIAPYMCLTVCLAYNAWTWVNGIAIVHDQTLSSEPELRYTVLYCLRLATSRVNRDFLLQKSRWRYRGSCLQIFNEDQPHASTFIMNQPHLTDWEWLPWLPESPSWVQSFSIITHASWVRP